MLVDDHDCVRRGVQSLISALPDWIVCAETTESDEALDLATEKRPNIIVMDISRPKAVGLRLIASIKQNLVDSEILALTANSNSTAIGLAVRAGARGYVLKSDGVDNIVNALLALSSHKPYFSPSVSHNLMDSYLNLN
jgi:DNA-binding NarL/FixJ family response regulator